MSTTATEQFIHKLNPVFTAETMEREFITPVIARRYLKCNIVDNRFLDFRRIETIARLMASGMWGIGGQPIQFNILKKLFDGQHRLQACIRALQLNPLFTGFSAWVAREHPVEAVQVTDIPKTRTPKNVFDIARGKAVMNTTRSQIARLLYYYNNEIMDQIEMVSSASVELLAIYENDIDGINSAADFGKLCGKEFGNIAPFGFAYWMLERMDNDGVEFMTKLRTGIGIVEGDPIYVFRQSYINKRINKAGGPIHRPAFFDAIYRAYLDWHTGAPAKKRYNFSRVRFSNFRTGFYDAIDPSVLVGLLPPVEVNDLRARVHKVNSGQAEFI